MQEMFSKLSSYAALLGVIGAIGGGFMAWGEFNNRIAQLENKEFIVNETVDLSGIIKEREEIKADVKINDAAIKFIEGKDKSFLNILYSKMDEYSSLKEFERAALYRDKIKAYRDIQKDQSVFTMYDNAVAITKKSNEYVYIKEKFRLDAIKQLGLVDKVVLIKN